MNLISQKYIEKCKPVVPKLVCTLELPGDV
jgi:hypothetical protein